MNRRKIIIQLLMETPSNDTSSSTSNESSILNTSSTNSVTSLSNEEENSFVDQIFHLFAQTIRKSLGSSLT